MRSTSSFPTDVESPGTADATPPQTSWTSWLAQWHRLVRTMHSLWLPPRERALRHVHGARVGYSPPVPLFLNAVRCSSWNASAARRIRSHGWPMAIAKGVAVVVCGLLIDTLTSVVAVGISLPLA